MYLKLKTKLILGLVFLFVMMLVFGILSIIYINKLSNDSRSVLERNHESLVYVNSMLKALDTVPQNREAFRNALTEQQNNITEVGEDKATQQVADAFALLMKDTAVNSNAHASIRQSLEVIADLNQQAILRKSNVAKNTAEEARLWLTIIFTVLIIFTVTFIFNFPSIISKPISALNEGIKEIAGKNYKKRIHLDQADEFGELAQAFNSMAEKLSEYESSNLAQLRFEKSRIETIINQMKDGIIGLDQQKNVIFMNERAEQLSGLKESQVVGKYAADIAVHNDLIRNLLQQSSSKELKIYADGKESFFHKEVLNVINNEEPVGEVIVLKNITSFHELNEAKTNFIATISHELKTPISSIKMSASLLDDDRVGGLNDEQLSLVNSITDDAQRLLKITGELLNMSQVETGNIQLKIRSADAGSIVQQAIQAVAPKAKEKNIHLLLPEHIATNVQADMDKTSWVLINFLTNAIKYSSAGSDVKIDVQQQKDQVTFIVQDNGPGIDEKYVPRLFDRYFKVPGTYEHDGTGLGLAISKEFIEAQGGTIKAESELGAGSSFSFSLPVAIV